MPMQIDWHDHFDRPQVATATRVVIRDQFGHPLAVAVDLDGVQLVSKRGDDDFHMLLQQIGERDQATTTRLNPQQFKEMRLNPL